MRSSCQSKNEIYFLESNWLINRPSLLSSFSASPSVRWLSFPVFVFVFFFATPGHVAFLGQGSDLSRSCDLRHSCSNVGSVPGRGSNLHAGIAEMPLILLCHSRNSFYENILYGSSAFFDYLYTLMLFYKEILFFWILIIP